MPTMLSHIRVKPEKQARWEEILRDMVRHTKAGEPDCLRYEYWRGQEPGLYYALLSFTDSTAFYAHQASDYHDAYMDDFADMFESLTMEWIDPVVDGGSGLAPTANAPVAADSPDAVKAQVALYPILIADWWAGARAAV